MLHACSGTEIRTESLWENVKISNYLKHLGIERGITLIRILEKCGEGLWTGYI
jgi:hypothetical protein